jgi:cytochrome c
MFDTMTLTKIVGGLGGTLLVFLLGNWAAELIYYGPETHGEEEAHQAYTIDTGSDAGGATEAVAEAAPDFAPIYAAADPAAGEKVFKACKACHKLQEGVNSVGPSLYGVVGRPVDSVAGYKYSGSLEKVVDIWTPENMNHFLTNPKGFAPGTKMGFKGLKKIEDRANLIAYLDSLDN